MPGAESGVLVRPTDIERWLDDLGLVPSAREDRDGVTSWDLRLDGRRRFDVPITLILDPAFALICWVHFAPPIGDAFRKSYRKLLRWNDEYPFVKFSLAEDDRPVLATEIAAGALDRDVLGLAIARSLAIADRLLEESAGWLWIGGRIPDTSGRTSRGAALLDRFADRLGELAGTAAADAPAASDEAGLGAAEAEADDANPAGIEAAIP
jgi:Putative bacterial sensory transduction regulator